MIYCIQWLIYGIGTDKCLILKRRCDRMIDRNFPIKQCPNCEGKSFTVKQYIHGYGEYYVDLENWKN